MTALGPILAVAVMLASVVAAIWWDERSHRRRTRRERDQLDRAAMRSRQQLKAGMTRQVKR